MHTIAAGTLPPYGNTGAENTEGIFLDWIACTFLNNSDIKALASELGESLDDKAKWNVGRLGYTDVWPIFGGWIAQNLDRPDMGIHLELPGKALEQVRLETKKTDAAIVSWLDDKGAKFTRLDVAFDVYSQDVLDLDDVSKAIKDGLCVSRWKTAKEFSTYELKTGQAIGGDGLGGFTFGSRSSRSYLRMYNKRQERLTKTGECERKYWIRVEMEYKGENAIAVAKTTINNASLDWFGGNLRYYLDIKEAGQTDANRSRWASADWWVSLTATVKTRLPLARKIVQDVVIASKRWVKKQVAPTLAFLLKWDGGDIRWLSEIMQDALSRLSAKHQRVLNNQMEGK
jgi:phage replication initiation protein